MKKFIFLLLVCCHAVSAQSIDQIIDAKIKASEAKQKAYADSLFKVKGDGGTQSPGNSLDSCKRGPIPVDVYNTTQSGATVLFDGDGVFGWDYTISQNGVIKVTGNSGTDNLQKNTVQILFSLAPGEYKISLRGNTCLSKEYSRTFTVPRPTGDNSNGSDAGNSGPPPIIDKTAKFQLIMGTTGSGFDSEAKYGISEGEWVDGEYREGWVDRIEAFKYSWGYGITGICVWIPWDSYEKKPGVYEEAAFKRVISFCRERGLTLSVAFMGRRHRGDGFIREDEIITGSNDTQYIEGVPETGTIYASYGNDRVNGLMVGAIRSISKLLKTYEKSFYMAMAGGGAGEQVNHTFQKNGIWEVADVSPANLNSFKVSWADKRGVPFSGRPPIIQGPWMDWPHPDYKDTTGVEFGRFTTYGIYKYYKNFVDAVKSVSEQPCLYFYSVTSNRQFRAIQNPNLNFIASPGDGMYGSDGLGLGDLTAKFKVNSVNLGTFPNGISAAEVDPHDISPVSVNTGRDPKYCEGGLDYNAFLNLSRDLYGRGLQVMHYAMAFCTSEIKGFEPVLKQLHQEYIGKPYVRPVINASNTVTVEVTEKYRNSIDLMEGINPYTQYTRYTDCNFWGAIKPVGATNCQ